MSKKLSKAYEIIGEDKLRELEALDSEGLKNVLWQSENAIDEAYAEVEANPRYQQAKQEIKDLSAGRREVTKRQKALICVVLSMLNNDDNT
jgi:hypothetical protein